uniref:Si:ch211-157b11.12 n=1 Tax=Amphiprion percula TaxID=161767 RepID=A0A3P8T7E8_AMPPE
MLTGSRYLRAAAVCRLVCLWRSCRGVLMTNLPTDPSHGALTALRRTRRAAAKPAARSLIRPKPSVWPALHQNSLECCGEKQRANNSCSNDTHCEPGCFMRVLENSNTVCIFCDSAAADLENITVCTYNYTLERKNHTTVTTVIPKIGGPGVAASLLLGTLLISLFLILSVASFFYLKRSNRLPSIFYRRNKAFIFQPSETAVMIPSSSVRKPRYVRRERPSATSTLNSATITTTSTTQDYNV